MDYRRVMRLPWKTLTWCLTALVPVLACGDDGDASTSASSTMGSSSSAGSGDTSTTASTTASSSDGSSGDASTGSGSSGSGSSGADSSSGGAEGTTGEPVTSCEADGDCTVVEDCCSCLAILQGTEAPNCDLQECLQSACGAMGVSTPIAQCELGSCELAPLPCNPFEVACDALPPECPEGMLPTIEGACWSGLCVPAALCDVVPDCAACPEDEACVQFVSQLPVTRCSPIPPACDGVPSCGCMGDDVCESPFDLCNDIDGAISCDCPVC